MGRRTMSMRGRLSAVLTCVLIGLLPACSPEEEVEPTSPDSPITSTESPVESTSGAVSGENPLAAATIAFTHEDVLYAAKGDGTGRFVITEFPGPPYPYAGAFWSPDGRQLIIRAETEPTPEREGAGYIFRVDVDGSDLVNLSAVSDSRGDAMPAWSPDGEHIVYAATKPGDRFTSLYVMKADGSEPQRLVQLDFEAQYPAWSSRDMIAFAGVVGENFDIYSVRSDGSDLTRLTRQPGQDNWPTYSPDGRSIAFFSVQDGSEGIWVMDADGGDAELIAEGGEPNWSPDGRWITFDCGDAERAVICAIRPDGSDLVELFEDATFPVIRPSG